MIRSRAVLSVLSVLSTVALAVMAIGCSSADDSGESTGSATTVEPATTEGADALTPTPETSAGSEAPESSTTVVTEASQVDDTANETSEPTAAEPDGVQPEGFTTATVRITEPDGEVCEVCMWLADDAGERGRGLMGVTDLGDAAGMVFVFERPTNGSFFMFQTVTPLSIAWFAPDGQIVSITDMDPCVADDSAQCERFPAGGEFDLAIEVFQGDLASVGIEAGSTAVVVPGTEAESCPATL